MSPVEPLPPKPALLDPPPLDRASLDALAPGFRYFNVAGCGPTFPVSRRAAESFGRWLDAVGMFSHVGYEAYNLVLAGARADLARALGDEGGAARIALQQSATHALNAVVAALRLTRGARLVTTDHEHAAALLPLYARRERGEEVVQVVYDGDDAAFLGRLAEALRPGGALLLSHVSHKDGAVLPVGEAVRLARERECFAIVDGAQALGQVDVGVGEIGCDAYCLLGHKWLHGPLATGALWVRDPEDARLAPTFVGWRSLETGTKPAAWRLKPNAERFETGTVDAAAFFGLAQALAVYRALGIAAIRERIRALRDRLLAGLEVLPVRLRSRPRDEVGIVSYDPLTDDVPGLIDRAWREHRVVIKLLTEAGRPDGVRTSFWYLHDEEAVDDLLKALGRLLAT